MGNTRVSNIGPIFGEVLRRYRVERRLSQEELAFRAGVDRTFVSRMECGVKQPTITTLVGLGLALEVSCADLVREAEAEYLRRNP